MCTEGSHLRPFLFAMDHLMISSSFCADFDFCGNLVHCCEISTCLSGLWRILNPFVCFWARLSAMEFLSSSPLLVMPISSWWSPRWSVLWAMPQSAALILAWFLEKCNVPCRLQRPRLNLGLQLLLMRSMFAVLFPQVSLLWLTGEQRCWNSANMPRWIGLTLSWWPIPSLVWSSIVIGSRLTRAPSPLLFSLTWLITSPAIRRPLRTPPALSPIPALPFVVGWRSEHQDLQWPLSWHLLSLDDWSCLVSSLLRLFGFERLLPVLKPQRHYAWCFLRCYRSCLLSLQGPFRLRWKRFVPVWSSWGRMLLRDIYTVKYHTKWMLAYY